jgi:transcription elongation factor GreA
MPERPSEQLTLAQKQQLEAQLAELEGPQRAAAVEAIAQARGYGDLSENFEYHAAKDEQGLLERRITILRARLDNAVLDDGRVAVGSTVVVRDDDGQRIEIEISSAGGVSPSSPLGRALLGAAVGDERDVAAPSGSWRARVVSVRR